MLSVIMPVYNEKDTVLKVIDNVLKIDLVEQIIIVDDNSTDGTKELLKNKVHDDRIIVKFHEKNKGKGACIKTGLKDVKGKIVTVQDSDLEYDPAELPELCRPIINGVADVVYGSRLWGVKPQRVHMFWHLLGNRFLSLLCDILYNCTLTDIETCYKVFKTDILKSINIKSNGFSFEPEVTAKMLKKKLKVYEMPISYYGRTYEEGKKITWKHGFEALWCLLKYRFID